MTQKDCFDRLGHMLGLTEAIRQDIIKLRGIARNQGGFDGLVDALYRASDYIEVVQGQLEPHMENIAFALEKEHAR